MARKTYTCDRCKTEYYDPEELEISEIGDICDDCFREVYLTGKSWEDWKKRNFG